MSRNLMKYISDNKITTKEVLAEKLKEEFGIKAKIYEEEKLVVLNYCQIESPKTHPIVRECRGTILEEAPEGFKLVCKPFDRFFNLGEALNVTEDFVLSNSEVLEKVDGSLIKVYYWNDSWRIATRGTAFAESENYTGVVFEQLVLEALGFSSLEEFDLAVGPYLDEKFSFIFEYISPKNRVVTPYQKCELVFLGSVCLQSLKEYHYPDYMDSMQNTVLPLISENIRIPKVYEPTEYKHELLNNISGLDEGFVCYDPHSGIRVKIKSDAYVAVHKLRGDSLPTPKRIMALVVENEQDEYLAYFPEDKELFQPFVEYLSGFDLVLLTSYLVYKDIKEQKDFAIAIKDLPYKPLLFMARKNSTSPMKEFKKLDNKQKVKYLTCYIDSREK